VFCGWGRFNSCRFSQQQNLGWEFENKVHLGNVGNTCKSEKKWCKENKIVNKELLAKLPLLGARALTY
jgi:hypothetical protein